MGNIWNNKNCRTEVFKSIRTPHYQNILWLPTYYKPIEGPKLQGRLSTKSSNISKRKVVNLIKTWVFSVLSSKSLQGKKKQKSK